MDLSSVAITPLLCVPGSLPWFTMHKSVFDVDTELQKMPAYHPLLSASLISVLFYFVVRDPTRWHCWEELAYNCLVSLSPSIICLYLALELSLIELSLFLFIIIISLFIYLFLFILNHCNWISMVYGRSQFLWRCWTVNWYWTEF